jgi:hypothetical protein
MKSQKMFRIAYELADWAMDELRDGDYEKFKRIKRVAEKYSEMYLRDVENAR